MSQRKVILSMQMTLDGSIASADDGADWLINDKEGWEDLFEILENADAFLLGRKMYPEYSTYWQGVLKNPNADPDELKFAKRAEKTQHIVFTRGNFTADWKNTRVAHDLPTEIANLKKQTGRNVIVWGGADFASNLINLGLLDEMRIQLNPTAIAGGKPLFGSLKEEKGFTLIDAHPLKSGLVILHYKVK